VSSASTEFGFSAFNASRTSLYNPGSVFLAAVDIDAALQVDLALALVEGCGSTMEPAITGGLAE